MGGTQLDQRLLASLLCRRSLCCVLGCSGHPFLAANPDLAYCSVRRGQLPDCALFFRVGAFVPLYFSPSTDFVLHDDGDALAFRLDHCRRSYRGSVLDCGRLYSRGAVILAPVKWSLIALFLLAIALVMPMGLLTIHLLPALNGATDYAHVIKMGYPVFWTNVLMGLAAGLGTRACGFAPSGADSSSR